MDQTAQLEEILSVCDKLGVLVRLAPLGGEGGGLCRIKGRTVLFVDSAADVGTRLQRAVEAVAELDGIDEQYLPPELREAIDRVRAGQGG
jgi:hypothetical protein